MTLYFPGWQL